VLMLWSFISAYLFLFGAEINARMERLCHLLGDESVEPHRRHDTADPLGER
jgi:uncharacterized BrkB/YihY/UPF0761 family membrane protein